MAIGRLQIAGAVNSVQNAVQVIYIQKNKNKRMQIANPIADDLSIFSSYLFLSFFPLVSSYRFCSVTAHIILKITHFFRSLESA
jgi:hypothetical protein